MKIKVLLVDNLIGKQDKFLAIKFSTKRTLSFNLYSLPVTDYPNFTRVESVFADTADDGRPCLRDR